MPSVYRQILGDELDLLPGTLRQFHDVENPCHFAGMARVTRGSTPLHHLAAWFGGLPPQRDSCQLKLAIEPATRFGVRGEIWRRQFDEFPLQSFQWAHRGLLYESFGWLSMVFQLKVSPPQLTLKVVSTRFAGIPLPPFSAPTGIGIETGKTEGIQFEANALAPILGLVVRYQGLIKYQNPATIINDNSQST